MDKEDVVHIYNIYIYTYTHNEILIIKKNEIMPFSATWMDLEMFLLNETSQRQIQYGMACMWNLKNDTNDLQNTNRLTDIEKCMVTKGEKGGGIN